MPHVWSETLGSFLELLWQNILAWVVASCCGENFDGSFFPKIYGQRVTKTSFSWSVVYLIAVVKRTVRVARDSANEPSLIRAKVQGAI